MKKSRKCHSYKARPSRGTKTRKDNEETKPKQMSHIKISTHEQGRTTTEKPPLKGQQKKKKKKKKKKYY